MNVREVGYSNKRVKVKGIPSNLYMQFTELFRPLANVAVS